MNVQGTIKTVWTEHMIHHLLEIWVQLACKLRANRKNNPLFNEMARDLGRRDVNVTAKEVRSKLNDLTQRYRDEKKKLGTGSTPSTWRYYTNVHEIIGAYRCNAVTAEDSLMTNEDDVISAPDSPSMFNFVTYENSLSSEDDSIPSLNASVSQALCTTETSSSSSPVAGPSSSSSAVAGPSSSSSAVAGPSSSKAARKRRNTPYKIQTKMLAEMKRSNELFINEMVEVRKAAQEQMELEKVFVHSTIKFQTDLMDFLKNNKK